MPSSQASEAELPQTIVTGAFAPTEDTGCSVGEPSVIDLFASEVPSLAPAPSTLPELRPPLVPGDLGACGGYRVLRVLGRGGMGAVYEALDPVLNRRVALKLMLPTFAASEEGRGRFLREARAAAAVHHANVVSVYAVGEDAGVPFLTMELLRGAPLSQHLAPGLPVAEVVRIGREVALGLGAAHALGVVHRDIKPANIWIEEQTGRVRLLDFGLARFGGDASADAGAGHEAGAAGGADLTRAGSLIGTLMYMAPEQAEGATADARTDLFALGVVLYQALSGRVPFGGGALRDLVDAIRLGVFAPLDGLVSDVPPDLVRLVHRLLAKDPADRPQDATEVAAELLAVATSLLVATGTGPVAVPVAPAAFAFEAETAPAPRRAMAGPRLFLLGTAAALLAVVLVTGVGVRLAAPQKPPQPPQVEPVKVAPPAAPKPVPVPFVPLIGADDLTGWHPPLGGKATAWSVQKGVLGGAPQPGGDQVLLSDATFADFELRLEYRWPKPGGHTTVLLRATDRYASDAQLAINIGDDEGFQAVHGRVIGGPYRTGLLSGVTSHPSAANRPIGQWNELHVVAKKHLIEVKVNKMPMPSADLSTARLSEARRADLSRPAGSIGLVCHFGQIEFRNVLVRPVAE